MLEMKINAFPPDVLLAKVMILPSLWHNLPNSKFVEGALQYTLCLTLPSLCRIYCPSKSEALLQAVRRGRMRPRTVEWWNLWERAAAPVSYMLLHRLTRCCLEPAWGIQAGGEGRKRDSDGGKQNHDVMGDPPTLCFTNAVLSPYDYFSRARDLVTDAADQLINLGPPCHDSNTPCLVGPPSSCCVDLERLPIAF